MMRQFKLTERYTPRPTKATDSYFAEVERTKPLSVDEEYEIGMRAKEGDIEARDILVKANLRFVISVAKKYSRDPVMFQDLVSVGNIGLIEAAEKFDPTMGFKFISYAVWHIRKEMINFISQSGKLIRVPQNRSNLIRIINDVVNELSMKEGRDPTPEEIIERVEEIEKEKKTKIGPNMTTSDVAMYMGLDIKPSSLDAPVGDDAHSARRVDFLEDDERQEEDKGSRRETLTPLLSVLLSDLSDIERKILSDMHGIGDELEISKNTGIIADEIGVTREAVRQKYQKALRKVKRKAVRSGISMDKLY